MSIGGHEIPRTLAFATAASLLGYRHWLIEEVASGAIPLAELLVEGVDDPRAGTVKVVVLIQAAPGIGKVRARRAMAALGVPESARLGELDLPIRKELARALTPTERRSP
jgi:hypothetical protein